MLRIRTLEIFVRPGSYALYKSFKTEKILKIII